MGPRQRGGQRGRLCPVPVSLGDRIEIHMGIIQATALSAVFKE